VALLARVTLVYIQTPKVVEEMLKTQEDYDDLLEYSACRAPAQSDVRIFYSKDYRFNVNKKHPIRDYLSTLSFQGVQVPVDVRYLLSDKRGVGVVPYSKKGKTYTLLKMPANMLYLLGMDVKFHRIKPKVGSTSDLRPPQIESLHHIYVPLPNGMKIPMRTTLTKSLIPVKDPGLKQLVELKKLTPIVYEEIVMDILSTTTYLHSQGIQGISHGFYIRNLTKNPKLTFIPSSRTMYIHYGVRNPTRDKVTVRGILKDMKNITSNPTVLKAYDDFFDEKTYESNLEKYAAVYDQGLREFKLKDKTLSMDDIKKYIYPLIPSISRPIQMTQYFVFLEMLQTLISLNLHTQLDYSKIGDPIFVRNIARWYIAGDEITRVYFNNLDVVKYLRAPIFHFNPEKLAVLSLAYGDKTGILNYSDDYQKERKLQRRAANFAKAKRLPGDILLRYPTLVPDWKQDYYPTDRQFTADDYSDLAKERAAVFRELYPEERNIPRNDKELYIAEVRKRRERTTQLTDVVMRRESKLARKLQDITTAMSTYNINLEVPNLSVKYVIINGVQFATYDLAYIFFDTPLANVANNVRQEYEQVELIGFTYSDLKLLRDFLMGRTHIVKLYKRLSRSAYNQMSSYGTILSAYEIERTRTMLCKMFDLGTPVILRIKQIKEKILSDLQKRGYEYLLQRISLI